MDSFGRTWLRVLGELWRITPIILAMLGLSLLATGAGYGAAWLAGGPDWVRVIVGVIAAIVVIVAGLSLILAIGEWRDG